MNNEFIKNYINYFLAAIFQFIIRLNMKFPIFSFTILAFLLISQTAVSQEKFRPGFIIANQGDTIQGYLRYKASKSTWKSCSFKETTGSESTEYNPSEILAYGYDEGKFFISKNILQSGEQKQVFLEFLIKGQANIYALADAESYRYFAETREDGLVELSEPETVVHTDSGNFYVKPKYKGKLTYMMNGYPQLMDNIEKTDLQSKSLIKLAKDYHDLACPGEECIIFESKFKPIKVKIGISGGLVFKSLNFTSRIQSNYAQGFNTGAILSISNLFFSDERFTLETGIQYSYINTFTLKNAKTRTEFEKVTYNNLIFYINPYDDIYVHDNYIKVKSLEADAQLSLVSLPLIIRYTFNSHKFFPSFGFGGVVSFTTNQNKNLKYHYFYDVLGNTFPSILGGFQAETSVKYKTGKTSNVGLGLKYLYESNIGNVNEFLITNTFVLQLIYTF
jgi:hypothetical protein